MHGTTVLGDSARNAQKFVADRNLFGAPTQKTWRAAVAQSIRRIKADFRLNNVELAERARCSDQTIANAENEDSDLSGVIVARLGYEFGEEYISAVRALWLCNNTAPKTATEEITDIIGRLKAIQTKVEAE